MRVESPEQRETQSHVTLVVNFFDEVRRRVGSRRDERPSRNAPAKGQSTLS
jgi:hypothetical protein